MAVRKLTKQMVRSAIEQIVSQGEPPTLLRIRAITIVGGYPLIKKWRAEILAENAELKMTDVVRDLTDEVRQLTDLLKSRLNTTA